MPSDEVAAAHSARSSHDGVSRRGLLRGAASMGAAGIAAGFIVGSGTASATTRSSQASPGAEQVPEVDGPMVAHVRDARTGEVDLYVGTRHVRFTDPRLAARLAQALR